MAVLHDYKCKKHGFFESMEAKCPKGCVKDVMMVFLKAPSLKSDKTKRNDKNIKQLADDYGMTNMRSTKEGESQVGYYTRNNKSKEKTEVQVHDIPREPRARDAAIWGGGMKGLNMQSIISGNAIRSVRGESTGVKMNEMGNLTGPKAASYVADHENLQIKK